VESFDDGDIRFGYKLDPHEAVASTSLSGNSDNEGIPDSDFPCSTQPSGKFSSDDSFHLQISYGTAAIITLLNKILAHEKFIVFLM
jgi:hypothetical protein